MLIADASEHVLSGPATVLLILGVWIVLLAAAFIPWRRIFSRNFWTHPTIAEMQAQMLRNVWAKWCLKKYGPWMSRLVIDELSRGLFGTKQMPIAFGHVRGDVATMLIKPGQMRYVRHDGPIFIGSTGGAGTTNGRKV